MDSRSSGTIAATARHLLSSLEGLRAMKTVCPCGFDCTDFVAHHAIPTGARFSCPSCELNLSAAEELSTGSSLDVNAAGMQAAPPLAAEGPNG
jgi:hypothetical protein